jgi:hypothetical protein
MVALQRGTKPSKPAGPVREVAPYAFPTTYDDVRDALDDDLDTPAAVRMIDEAAQRGFDVGDAASLMGVLMYWLASDSRAMFIAVRRNCSRARGEWCVQCLVRCGNLS